MTRMWSVAWYVNGHGEPFQVEGSTWDHCEVQQGGAQGPFATRVQAMTVWREREARRLEQRARQERVVDEMDELSRRGPVEPNADLRVFAAHMFEMRVALLQEGFSPTETMTIIGQVIAAAMPSA